MKKIVLIFILGLIFNHNVCAQEKPVFLHPIFYQQLSTPNRKAFYVLNPNSKYYENSEENINQSVPCSLVENQEYYIKILCDDCNNIECLSHTQNTHLFFLSKDITLDNNYIITHKIFDETGNIKFEEILTNDGLITIPPYQ